MKGYNYKALRKGAQQSDAKIKGFPNKSTKTKKPTLDTLLSSYKIYFSSAFTVLHNILIIALS
jgi:hypothetical protein